VSGDNLSAPIRCTQNPSMGEEWRRGWHPEHIAPKTRDARVLVVGAGPAGLEAAQALGKRSLEVVLVEAGREVGGRVTREAALPGLASWRRVVDYRMGQIDKLPNVELFRESPMSAEEILGHGFDHVAIATGATWKADGVGRANSQPIPIDPAAEVLTADDLMAGKRPRGERVFIYDDDHYYLGGVLAELLVTSGYEVEIITPSALVSSWTVNTMEQVRIHRRLLELGVGIRTEQAVVEVGASEVALECVITERREQVGVDSVVMVTSRKPNDQLAEDLQSMSDRWDDAGLRSVRAIGDAWVPSTIASAVWWGHRYARELDTDDIYLRRELVQPSD